jgi:hypothetical protein
MDTTFEDNLALCRSYRQKIEEGQESLQSFFLENSDDNTNVDSLAVDIVNLERALTVFMAEKTGLEIDRQIFRGSLPPGRNGCSIGVSRLDLGLDENIPTVFVQFVCRDTDRNEAVRITSNLCRQFPVSGMSVTLGDGAIVNARLISVIRADIQTGQADDGRLKTFGYISFKVQL